MKELFTQRHSLDQICEVPEKIISVYALEQHVWAEFHSQEAQRKRQPELQTIREFQFDPVRPFLNDIFRNMAAPYKPERKDQPTGQGYWIQADFGSGKSHLLCTLATLALGGQEAWDLVRQKENEAGRGKRESLYQFWEDGLASKQAEGKRGIFVVVKTLVGVGGTTVGTGTKGNSLTEYILNAVREQLFLETGQNLSLYPAELLADRFLSGDLARYRNDLKKFLRDPKYFNSNEVTELDEFLQILQNNKSPDYKLSCGNKLWRFYTEYLKVQPQIAVDNEDILKHMVEVILAEGYSGVLIVLDEVSLFMKTRTEEQRDEDEKTLVVLANRLAKIHNLPVWTVCAAQQAIESKLGVKNIIADDRLKLIRLLEGNDKAYYDIVLSRVRKIKDETAISGYYQYYKRGFTWPNAIGEEEFKHFFPFHKPALEVLRALTFQLTTTRSAIHFMHQTLRHQIKHNGNELIRLWELFDEAMTYEEDPSGTNAGMLAVKTRRETEYKVYEICKRQIESMTKGTLKVYRDKAIKTIQTLFLYYIANLRQNGLTPEEIANSVLIERQEDSDPVENNQHYESLTEALKKELRQIVQTFDEDHRPRYRFDPVVTGIDPRAEFQKARDEAENSHIMRQDAWDFLLALDGWAVKTRQMTLDLSWGVQSTFRSIAPFKTLGDQTLEVNWQNRFVTGLIAMRDLRKQAMDNTPLPPLETADTERDFALYVSTSTVSPQLIDKLLKQRKDPRVLLWTPGELNSEEKERLLDLAAYRKLISQWEGKETEDAVAVIHWVHNSLQTDMGRIARIVDNNYARGRVDSLLNQQMDFHVAGELVSIVTPLVNRVLTATYESRELKFDPNPVFRKEDVVKVINGIVKTGNIPRGSKPNQDISAAQNFGFGLKIMKKSAERQLDVSDNTYVQAIWNFIDNKLTEDNQTMKLETLYKNFMGLGEPKNWGLSRRMVQLYLLCLVREGRLRMTLSSKSGLSISTLDATNIAGVDFSAKVLEALTDVQKMVKPEKWEVLRPYAEKLLGEEIPLNSDDAAITRYRLKLRELFNKENGEAARLIDKAVRLFDILKTVNPYEQEMRQIARLFQTDLTGNDDIYLILYGLKEALDYRAFDEEAVSQSELDDLANRIKNYRDLVHFLSYSGELETAYTYCNLSLPDEPELRRVLKLQQELGEKFRQLKRYIDSDVQLRTELIGRFPPQAGETASRSGTLGVLLQEYISLYCQRHDQLLDYLEQRRQEINQLVQGEEWQALRQLEQISALQPPISATLERELLELAQSLFTCPNSSKTSIEGALRSKPQHECELSFANMTERWEEGRRIAEEAHHKYDESIDHKMEVFLNVTVRQRLRQGESEPVIAGLLKCNTTEKVRAYLTTQDGSIVELINHYLKRIAVKKVRMSDFHPVLSTVELRQIPELVKEFQQFLTNQLQDLDNGEDTLPMLQVE